MMKLFRRKTDPFVSHCTMKFAAAHGMSVEETEVMFEQYRIERYIRRNKAGLGHTPEDIVPILRNVIIIRGGEPPEMQSDELHRTCFGILDMTEDDVDRIIAERPDVFRDLKDLP